MLLVFLPMFYAIVIGQGLKADEVELLHQQVSEIPWLQWISFFVLFAVPPACIDLSAQLRHPAPLQPSTEPLDQQLAKPHENRAFRVLWRYVTRGQNCTLVAENLEHMLGVLRDSGLPEERWGLEVVTDQRMALSCKVTVQIVVPEDYKCPNGAKYKARALHYAAMHLGDSRTEMPKPQDWIVHLDEETRADVHTVAAVYAFCQKEHLRTVSNGKVVDMANMAQGVIVYNTFAHMIENPVTALTDCSRVGGDYGKFLMCSRMANHPLLGMHGSFVVATQHIEETVGFDHGITGSITEDYYFALMCWKQHDVRVKRIDAFMFEQSPFTCVDLIRQRARWFQGNAMCVWADEFPWAVKRFGQMALICWVNVPLTFMSLSLVWMLPAMTPPIACFTALVCGYGIWSYLLGFILSYSPRSPCEGGLGLPMWLTMLSLLILLQPVFGLLEVLGMLWGARLYLSDTVGFYIVKKESHKEVLNGAGLPLGKHDSGTTKRAQSKNIDIYA